jgi:hypothetical protein
LVGVPLITLWRIFQKGSIEIEALHWLIDWLNQVVFDLYPRLKGVCRLDRANSSPEESYQSASLATFPQYHRQNAIDSEEAMRVFVLLFNARTENEGIHTLKMGDRNIVLMFESEDDATSYALLLEAQDFPTPAVESIEQEEVEEFCQSAGYEGQFVPKGFVPQSEADRLLMSPPETNAEQTDWQPEESQPKPMADAELERIRRQLEGLL